LARALGVLLLLTATVLPALAQALSDGECESLLVTDEVRAPLRDAAARNLEASALGEPSGLGRRQVTEYVLRTMEAPGQRAAALCERLTVERVGSEVLLTGYYRPLVPARRAREGAFRYPLYAVPPPDLREHSRAEIDAGVLDGKVPVVAWLDDPVEVFFIHVQGSALLDMPEGTVAVGFAGSNDRPYTSIGSIVVRQGRMPQEEVSMESLKGYLHAHPSQRDEILHANERYIYFAQADGRAIGSMGVPVTPGRSVAADLSAYPPGTLLFIQSVATARGVPPRLAFVQDRGSAIVGRGRLDLFLGTGEAAGRIAGELRQEVQVYVLDPK
jgi:membrane-bound lytic murein transglycosylase A